MRPVLKWVLPILVAAAGVGVFLAFKHFRPETERQALAPNLPVVTVVPVAPGDRQVDAVTQGHARPEAITVVSAEVMGVVVAVSSKLREGARVAAGEELLRIDDADYRAAVASAQAQLALNQQRLAEERAAAVLAAEEWKSLGRGEPTELALRKPQLAAVEAQIAAAQAQLAQAQRNLERTVLRAPFAGRLRSKQVELGQRVAPGQALMSLQATAVMEVVLPVTLEQLRFLELPLDGDLLEHGPAVRCTAVVADRATTWDGAIHRTLSGLDPHTRMVHAVARIPQSEDGPPLLDGLFVTAEISGRVVPDVIALPEEAVQPGDICYVFMPIADQPGVGELQARQLEVLRRRNGEALVRGPLAADEQVIAVRIAGVREGMHVRLAPDEDVAAGDADASVETTP